MAAPTVLPLMSRSLRLLAVEDACDFALAVPVLEGVVVEVDLDDEFAHGFSSLLHRWYHTPRQDHKTGVW